jgi:hypothetical protein
MFDRAGLRNAPFSPSLLQSKPLAVQAFAVQAFAVQAFAVQAFCRSSLLPFKPFAKSLAGCPDPKSGIGRVAPIDLSRILI